MLYREIMAVCSYFHTKHINSLYGHKLAPLFVQRESLASAISNRLTNMPNYGGPF